jgi:uncharacterized membrane protein (DUF106 family)
MHVVNAVLGRVFDVLLLPVSRMTPWAGLVLIALLTSLFMLFVYRHTSNQAGIRKTKDRIKAHLLELRLYNDNMAVSLRAQRRILVQNLRYLVYNLKPLLVMIVPIVLILAQLNLRYGSAPLRPGEEALVKAKLTEGLDPMDTVLTLEAAGAVAVETPPVRISDEGEVAWRLRAKEPGPASLRFTGGGLTVDKAVAVGGPPLAKVSDRRVGRSILDQALYPGEPPLPGRGPVRSIEILYPARRLSILGIGINWLVGYFILSMIFGFGLKGVFKVEI